MMNNNRCRHSSSGCHVAESNDMAPAFIVNNRWRGRSCEYLPRLVWLKKTNNVLFVVQLPRCRSGTCLLVTVGDMVLTVILAMFECGVVVVGGRWLLWVVVTIGDRGDAGMWVGIVDGGGCEE